MTQTRTLGGSGIEVSAIGFGCWAIGGPLWAGEQPLGWGPADDDESARAIHAAIDAGITFFDTASNYGAGHSERVLGKALKGKRDSVVVATKWGNTIDEATRQNTGEDGSPEFVRASLDASLARLGMEYVDLFQLHINALPIERALALIPPLEEAVAAGKIRAYGWSTDHPERAEAFAQAGPHCVAIQFGESVLRENAAMVALCEKRNLAGINKGPLAMGLLSDKYLSGEVRLGPDDIRGKAPQWLEWFRDGAAAPEFAAKVEALRDALTAGGRTLAQGSLGWLLARSPRLIPIPGIRTVAQARENAGALGFGPLTKQEFAEVQSILDSVA